MEVETAQIEKIEKVILEKVLERGRVPIKDLRHELSGFRSLKDPNGIKKITKEEIDWIIGRLYRQNLIRKQRRWLWIPMSIQTLSKIKKIGLTASSQTKNMGYLIWGT